MLTFIDKRIREISPKRNYCVFGIRLENRAGKTKNIGEFRFVNLVDIQFYVIVRNFKAIGEIISRISHGATMKIIQYK